MKPYDFAALTATLQAISTTTPAPPVTARPSVKRWGA